MDQVSIDDLSFLERSSFSAAQRQEMYNRGRTDVDYSALDPTDELALAKWKTPGTITEIGGRALVKTALEEDVAPQEATA